MPTPPLSRAVAQQTVALVEACVKEGYSISGTPSAIQEAARRLKLAGPTVSTRLHSAKRLYGLQPEILTPELAIPGPVDDDRKRLKDRDLASEVRKLRELLVDATDIRSGVLKLIDPPLRPRIDIPVTAKHKGARTVIIHLSDWHCGEVVDIDEMGGLNSFNLKIFNERVGRLGKAAKELLTTHWNGSPPEKIVLILGGDMITGEIHMELAQTNDALSAPAVRHCAETLSGLLHLLSQIAPVDVYSLPGNHGRLTMKPQSKGMASNSFDTLITQVVEMVIRIDQKLKSVRFFYPKSGDALFKIYGLTFCAAHGDRIGAKGGQGFLGATATILRGIAKTKAYYASQGVLVDYILVGHFHTTAKFQNGFSNGSLIGPSEYSRDLRATPEQAKQNMIVVQSEKGVISFEELFVGSEKEGAIYRGVV